MNKPGNNIKAYTEFDMTANTQKIGIFVFTRGNFQSTTYVRLLSTFNNFPNKKFEFCIIETTVEEEYKKVKEDLINDKFLLDIVIIERDAFPSNEFVELLIEKCKLLGIKIIYEIDDDLMNIDESHRDYDYFKQKSLGIYNIVKNADVVTVSTNMLKSKLNNLNNNIIVIPNVITHYWNVSKTKTQIKKSNNLIKIGYIGSTTHHHDIQLLKSTIEIVNKNYENSNKKIVFEMIGGSSEKLSWIHQIPIPLSPIDKTVFPNFTKFVEETVDWDIALAPLEDNNINSSKSELKYLEYTCLGLPGIYSNIGPYKENIIHECNGILVNDNSPEEWAKNIINLIENNNLRENILKNAKIDMNTNYNLNISIEMWEEILNKYSRDKKSLLFKKFNLYQKSNLKCSFLEFLKQESYNIIKNSELFDTTWYLSEYPDVKFAEIDPITHYLNLGANENCRPLKNFNTEEYLIKFHNLKIWNLNPFVHYLLHNEILQTPWWRFEDNIEATNFEKNSEIIKNSFEFDENYYINCNENNIKNDITALDHWVKFGYKINGTKCNPNSYFSKKFYSDKYLINGEETWNCLTHYEIIGKQKGYKQNIFDITYQNYSNNLHNIKNAFIRETTIIIPIFSNSIPIDFQECLNYLYKNTSENNEFIFIVEKSFLHKINELLKNFNYDYTIIKIDYISNMFKILDAYLTNIDKDIVILNSFSIVTKNWLNKLIIKAYSKENIDMVSPLSNLLIDISKFKLEKIKSKNGFFNFENLNKIIEKSADLNNIKLEYFDGSCIFIKKNSITKINFNESIISFNKKEKIFGVKIGNNNLNYLLDDSTFIYCNPNFLKNSYLNHQNKLLLSLKIKEFSQTFEIKNIIKNIKNAITYSNSENMSNRLLYILNEEYFNNNYQVLGNDTKDIFFLTENQKSLKLWKNHKVLKKWNINRGSKNSTMNELKIIYFNICSSLNISEINIYDFIYPKSNLINLAKIMGIKINLYIINSYIFCPFSYTNFYCNNDCNQTFICHHNHLKKILTDYDLDIMNIFNTVDNIFVKEIFKEIFKEKFSIRLSNVQYIK